MKLFPKFHLVDDCLPYVTEESWAADARHYNMEPETFRKFVSMNRIGGLCDWHTGNIYIRKDNTKLQRLLIGIHELCHYYVGRKYGIESHWHNKIEKYLSFQWAFYPRKLP